MMGEIVAEILHLLLVGAVQRHIWNLVESDEVYAAVEALEQMHKFLGVCRGVVESVEDDVLERQPSLVREVVVAQQVDDIGYRHTPLGGHELGSLLRERRVQTDGHVALALVEEALQLSFHANTADGYALRTPCVAVRGCKNARCAQYVVEVVHRLALAHEYDVRYLVAFR